MKRIKQIFTAFLAAAILSGAFFIPAFAGKGSGNMNGGGGGMGHGNSQNVWDNGDDGIRVTVVQAGTNRPVSRPFDMTNRNEGNIEGHFIKKSKLTYRSGSPLVASRNKYTYVNPSKRMPTIITGNSHNNIPAIKHYFCSSETLKKIASIVGCGYNKLTDGEYKLLLEPIAYFTFQGHKWAMTATEAALYNRMAKGKLRSRMVSLTSQNLPLSLFLERADLGYPAYSGSRSRPQSDTIIIRELGLGIVKFKGGITPPPDKGYGATYRTNTDVVTSVVLSADSQITPKSPARVTFHILGGSFTRTNVVIPEGKSQLVWVKWHTPSTPQKTTITVSTDEGDLNYDQITANIVTLDEKTPPNPTATDRDNNFKVPSPPATMTSTSNTWSVWNAHWVDHWVWQEDWVWVEHKHWKSGGEWKDRGKWVNDGYWVYNKATYRASLTSSMDLEPDGKDPTAHGKHMRSGYGVDIKVSTGLSTSSSFANVAEAQNAITYFPEFAYHTYWRVLDPTLDRLSSSFAFKNNIYSTYDDRTHFTPVWYPDGTYTAYTYVEDAWTPAGMLTAKLTDSTIISGSVFDDWHIGPEMVN